MTSQDEMRALLSVYLAKNPNGDKKLAKRFEVAVSTVKRWRNGMSNPHPILCEQIINYVKGR